MRNLQKISMLKDFLASTEIASYILFIITRGLYSQLATLTNPTRKGCAQVIYAGTFPLERAALLSS